eukprot:TRINITY_DN4314_c0_g1_i1.p1 TRINITY_DN4314_c0_g1~~TRINITY_DN4314_c0_g1_i1.p1  ORF type:complete len:239 (+),score=19.00 TRINITY_DN4314_c0_g1_i1:89-718(+)
MKIQSSKGIWILFAIFIALYLGFRFAFDDVCFERKENNDDFHQTAFYVIMYGTFAISSTFDVFKRSVVSVGTQHLFFIGVYLMIIQPVVKYVDFEECRTKNFISGHCLMYVYQILSFVMHVTRWFPQQKQSKMPMQLFYAKCIGLLCSISVALITLSHTLLFGYHNISQMALGSAFGCLLSLIWLNVWPIIDGWFSKKKDSELFATKEP